MRDAGGFPYGRKTLRPTGGFAARARLISVWKFFFRMPSPYNSDEAFAQSVEDYYGMDGERLPNIKVEIDAYTGEVAAAFTIDFGDFGYQNGDDTKGREGYLKVF